MRTKPYFYSYKYPCHVNMSKWASTYDGNELNGKIISDGIDTFDLLKYYLTVDGYSVDIQTIDFTNINEISLVTTSDAEFLENCVVIVEGTTSHNTKIRITEVINRREFKAEMYDLDEVVDNVLVSGGTCKRSSLGWHLLYEDTDEMVLKPNNPNFGNCIYFRRLSDVTTLDGREFESRTFKDIYPTLSIGLNVSEGMNNIYLLAIQLWNYDSSKTIEENIQSFEVVEDNEGYYEYARGFSSTYGRHNYARLLHINKLYVHSNYNRHDKINYLDWFIYGDDKFVMWSNGCYWGGSSGVKYTMSFYGEINSIDNIPTYAYMGNTVYIRTGKFDRDIIMGIFFNLREYGWNTYNRFTNGYTSSVNMITINNPNDYKTKITIASILNSNSKQVSNDEYYSTEYIADKSFSGQYYLGLAEYNLKHRYTVPYVKLPIYNTSYIPNDLKYTENSYVVTKEDSYIYYEYYVHFDDNPSKMNNSSDSIRYLNNKRQYTKYFTISPTKIFREE